MMNFHHFMIFDKNKKITDNYTTKLHSLCGGTHGIMVIVIVNGYDELSSHPGWGGLHLTKQ